MKIRKNGKIIFLNENDLKNIKIYLTESKGNFPACIVNNPKKTVSRIVGVNKEAFKIENIYFYSDGTAKGYDRKEGIEDYEYNCEGDKIVVRTKNRSLYGNAGVTGKIGNIIKVIEPTERENVEGDKYHFINIEAMKNNGEITDTPYRFDSDFEPEGLDSFDKSDIDFKLDRKKCVIDSSLDDGIYFNKDGGVCLNSNYVFEEDNNYIYYDGGTYSMEKKLGGDGKTEYGTWSCNDGDIVRVSFKEEEERGKKEDEEIKKQKKQGNKKISKNLRRGSRGEKVKQMQLLLGRILGVDGVAMSAIGCKNNYDYTTCDGIFGKNTDKYVRQFQKKEGLVDDGIVGPKTFAKLVEINNDTELATDDTTKGGQEINPTKNQEIKIDNSSKNNSNLVTSKFGTEYPENPEDLVNETEISKPILDMMRRMNILK